MKILGILETGIYVSDLDRSREFYQGLFGFKEIYREQDRMIGMSVAGRQVLLLFAVGGSVNPTEAPGGIIPPHDARGNQHFAFSIEQADVGRWREKLAERAVPVESEVRCEGGGQSIYFRDPDGHLVELITAGCWQGIG